MFNKEDIVISGPEREEFDTPIRPETVLSGAAFRAGIGRKNPHSELVKKTMSEVRRVGGYVFGALDSSKNGVPDVICCIRGKFVALEVKTGKGRLTDFQVINFSQIQAAGGIVHEVRSIEDVKSILEKVCGEEKSS